MTQLKNTERYEGKYDGTDVWCEIKIKPVNSTRDCIDKQPTEPDSYALCVFGEGAIWSDGF